MLSRGPVAAGDTSTKTGFPAPRHDRVIAEGLIKPGGNQVKNALSRKLARCGGLSLGIGARLKRALSTKQSEAIRLKRPPKRLPRPEGRQAAHVRDYHAHCRQRLLRPGLCRRADLRQCVRHQPHQARLRSADGRLSRAKSRSSTRSSSPTPTSSARSSTVVSATRTTPEKTRYARNVSTGGCLVLTGPCRCDRRRRMVESCDSDHGRGIVQRSSPGCPWSIFRRMPISRRRTSSPTGSPGG